MRGRRLLPETLQILDGVCELSDGLDTLLAALVASAVRNDPTRGTGEDGPEPLYKGPLRGRKGRPGGKEDQKGGPRRGGATGAGLFEGYGRKRPRRG